MKKTLLLACLPALLTACAHMDSSPHDGVESHTIAFGSCLRQWQGQPVWESIANQKPAAFIFAGDNVYADVGPLLHLPPEERAKTAYAELALSSQFSEFRHVAEQQGIQLLATWDDHDYGLNDAGAEFPFKLENKQQFLAFFGTDQSIIPTSEPGIYHSKTLTLGSHTVQVLLLDTRSFRSPLNRLPPSKECPHVNNGKNSEVGATMLGEEQWQWLEQELRKPADLRLLVSSIQLIPSQHCFEKWSNFPKEREKLLELIRNTEANGVIILSGDRHLAEISALPSEAIGYPLYEITSSGLNSAMGVDSFGKDEINDSRMFTENVRVNNFGSIHIEPNGTTPQIAMRIHGENGAVLQEKSVALSKLKPKRIISP